MSEMSLSEFANRQKPPKREIKIPHTGLITVGAVVLALGGFLAGVQYQKGKTPIASTVKAASSQSSNSSGGQGGFGGGFRRGNRAFGTVSSVSSSSITVQTRNGSTSTYTVTGSTTVTNDGQSASISDVQSGDTVILTLDSSNTQDVTSIMLNPSFGGGSGPGGYGGGGQDSQTSPTAGV